MWEVSPRCRLRHASLPLSVVGVGEALMGVRPTPSRTYFCCGDVLLWRGLRLPSECECWGAVVGGSTQSSGGKDVLDPTSQARVRARRPRNREGSGASIAVEAMARFCGETILPRPPPMVLAASRIFGSSPAPWAAVACRLANRVPVAAWAAPGDGPRQRAGPRPAQRSTDGARRRDRPAAIRAGPGTARSVRPAMPARTSATA